MNINITERERAILWHILYMEVKNNQKIVNSLRTKVSEERLTILIELRNKFADI